MTSLRVKERLRSALGAAARACHEVNRSYRQAIGEDVSLDPYGGTWDTLPSSARQSAIDGVCLVLEDPSSTPERLHAAWMEDYVAAGWTWGPEKDSMKKTHPCLRPWRDLEPEDKRKDELFLAVARAMIRALGIQIREEDR